MSQYDVIVVGAGPGGYVAAIRAAQLGLKTAIVEREHLGGVCLNWGCIPTKALLRSAEVLTLARNATAYGVAIDGAVQPDLGAMVSRSRAVSAQLNGGVGYLLKKNRVDVIWGEAFVTAPGRLSVQPSGPHTQQPQHQPPKGVLPPGTYEAEHIILATGARPRILPTLEPDGKLIWTYFDALRPETAPKSLLVVGSGAIGVEFASFYRTLGAEVTIIEAAPRILSAEDAEIAAFAHKQFEKQGIRIFADSTVEKIEKRPNSVLCKIQTKQGDGPILEAERVLVAAGVLANVTRLGLEALGVAMERGCVKVDEWGRTNIDGLYAIGDVAGAPMLAHKAEHEAVICVEAIAGQKPHPIMKTRIPGCTYCHPQIASVGLTEEQAENQNHAIKVGRFPLAANGKAIALGEAEGLIKTIFDAQTGTLLGAHLIGPDVTELIHSFVVAMNCETTEQELIETIYPHPTLSEALHESVLDAYGRVLHK